MEFKKEMYDMENLEKAWCPGCGNFAFHKILTAAMAELELDPKNTVFCSGIGQAAKMPQYIKTHMFNGLHGRSLPAAMAIKSSNPDLNVLVYSGDGCSYGEGGNHFVHQICRNPDITHFVSNNQIYGLTKGQGSPTTLQGTKTTVQIHGVTNKPFNPLGVALSLGATFVARIFVGDQDKSVEIVKKAILHKGYALVDAFSPCVSFNKLNTYKWYKENSYYLGGDGADYDSSDIHQALSKSLEDEKYPLGIFYQGAPQPTFWENSHAYTENKKSLYEREVDLEKIKKVIESYKG